MRSAISLNTSCSEMTWLRALLVQLAKTWLEAGRSSQGLLAVRLLKHHLPLGMLLVYQMIELQTSYDCRKPPKRSCQLHMSTSEPVPKCQKLPSPISSGLASLLNAGSLQGVDLWPGNPKSFKGLRLQVMQVMQVVCTSLPATILKLNFSFSSSQSAKGLSG